MFTMLHLDSNIQSNSIQSHNVSQKVLEVLFQVSGCSHLSVNISIGQIPDDEDIGDRDEIFSIRSDANTEWSEGMPFQ